MSRSTPSPRRATVVVAPVIPAAETTDVDALRARLEAHLPLPDLGARFTRPRKKIHFEIEREGGGAGGRPLIDPKLYGVRVLSHHRLLEHRMADSVDPLRKKTISFEKRSRRC